MLSGFKWQVHEVLRGHYANDVIEVFPSDWSWNMDMHIAYYVQGLSQSPIVEEYVPEFEGPPWLLFLQQGDDGRWEFSVEGSKEGVEAEPKVRGLLGDQDEGASEFRVSRSSADGAARSRRPWTGWLAYGLLFAVLGLLFWQC